MNTATATIYLSGGFWSLRHMCLLHKFSSHLHSDMAGCYRKCDNTWCHLTPGAQREQYTNRSVSKINQHKNYNPQIFYYPHTSISCFFVNHHLNECKKFIHKCKLIYESKALLANWKNLYLWIKGHARSTCVILKQIFHCFPCVESHAKLLLLQCYLIACAYPAHQCHVQN